jgi:hypothetical protein
MQNLGIKLETVCFAELKKHMSYNLPLCKMSAVKRSIVYINQITIVIYL